MKKAKLFASIASICFAFAVLVFGIYAAEQVNYQVNGTLTYEVNDCYVTVETSVYYSPTSYTQQDLYSKMEVIVDSSSGTSGLTHVPYNNLNYNSYLDTSDGANQKQINMVFEGKRNNSPKQAYFIVMTVTNIGGRDINIGVNTPISLPNNVYSINSGLCTSVGTGTDNAKRLVVAFSLEDKLSPVTPRTGQETTSYSMSLKAEIDDEDTTELNVYDYNQSTGAITKTSRTEELAIDLCVPSYVNGHKVTKALDFSDCTQLTSISIPSTVTEMGENIFYNCPNLRSLTLPFVGKKNYDSLQDLVNLEGGLYLRGSMHYMFGEWGEWGPDNNFERIYTEIFDWPLPGLSCPYEELDDFSSTYDLPKHLTTIHLLYGCKCINAFCFCNMEGNNFPITNFYIPCTVSRLEAFCFTRAKLSNTDFMEHINYIGYWSMGFCRLDNVTIYNGEIAEAAFNASDLKTIRIMSGVTEIGNYAFSGCQQVREITIEEGISSIGVRAFDDIGKLGGLSSITIPASVTYIGDDAFNTQDSNHLKTIILKGGNVNIDGRDSHPFFYGYCSEESDWELDYHFNYIDGYSLYVPEEYYDRYANDPKWADYFEAGVLKSDYEISLFKVTYQVPDGVMEMVYNEEISDYEEKMPLVNLLNRTDQNCWHQFNSSVVSRDHMDGSANYIFRVCDNVTNAIYTDVSVIPSDDIQYSIRVKSGYVVYIYYFNYGSDTFVPGMYAYELEFPRSDTILKEDKEGKDIIFGRDVTKIRFVLTRYKYVSENDEKNGEKPLYTPTKILPYQVTTSMLDDMRLSPMNTKDVEQDNGNSKIFVGYYKPGYAIEMPYMMTVPYKDYNHLGWMTDNSNEDSAMMSIDSSQVEKFGSINVYALWNPNVRGLYFNLNFRAANEYIKIDGINVTEYGTNMLMADILDYVFAMKSIQELMTENGIDIDDYGYPTNYQISGLSMPQGKKGAFAEYNSYWDNWSVRGSTMGNDFDNWGVHFTSGDVYICVDSWY